MTKSDFARRHGYQSKHQVFKNPDYLPKGVRERAGMMMIKHCEILVAETQMSKMPVQNGRWLFVQALRDTLPPTSDLWNWYDDKFESIFSHPVSRHRHTDKGMRYGLIHPLTYCDWRLFYEAVENVCARWESSNPRRCGYFASELNFLLASQGIPWKLQSGWVTPAGDYEFADELRHAREVAHPPISDHVPDPHALIRNALDALYHKQGGPDLESANMHAWAAWKAVAGAVSGFGSRDVKAFKFVKDNHPRIANTMEEWRETAEGGRHPEDGDPLTEADTRFIVMLCVNAVRFLCPTCNAKPAP